jgi:hypothetical protein
LESKSGDEANAGTSSLSATKEKAERWTRRRAFAEVRRSSNIQLLPYS